MKLFNVSWLSHVVFIAIDYNFDLESSPLQLPTVKSSPSGSDYAADREARRRRREFYRDRGKSVSDTDEEDVEEDEELELSAVAEHGRTPPRFTAKQKGKEKAKPVEVEGEEDPGYDEEDEEEEAEGEESGNKRGPLSKAAIKEAVQLGKETRKSAEILAKKYGKPVRSIMVSAGLAIQNAREPNFSNLYKVWYAHHHPSPDGSKIYCVFLLICYLIGFEF